MFPQITKSTHLGQDWSSWGCCKAILDGPYEDWGDFSASGSFPEVDLSWNESCLFLHSSGFLTLSCAPSWTCSTRRRSERPIGSGPSFCWSSEDFRGSLRRWRGKEKEKRKVQQQVKAYAEWYYGPAQLPQSRISSTTTRTIIVIFNFDFEVPAFDKSVACI